MASSRESVILNRLLRFIPRRRSLTIRNRLLMAFLLMVLIPAISFGAAAAWVGVRSGRQQVLNQLTSVAVLKEAEVNTWARSVKADLSTVTIGSDVAGYMRTLLSSPVESAEFQSAHAHLYNRFGAFLEQTQRLDQIFLVNLERHVVLSTDRQHEGSLGSVLSSVGSGAYLILQQGLRGDYGDLIALTRLYQGFVVIAVRSVHGERGELLGLVVGHASSARLSEIMLERAGLGETGETYLVNQNATLLTTSRYQVGLAAALYSVMSEGPRAALFDHVNGSGVYHNYHHERVIGVYRWLPELQAVLVAEQTEREAMGPVYQMVAVNLGVALAAALIAGAIALLVARTIVLPLDSLAHTATRITGGEYSLAAPVQREDEIGTLARAFNTMTARLQELINSLDQRVRERTQMLRRRALQLETSTRVSREITSILAMEELLNRVVNLIAETFEYYHVGIYLVDTESGKLVFRSGAGAVARLGLAQGNRLEIGPGSLNGEAAGSNEAIVVNDVLTDPRYFADESLPETRSELVAPLRIGERVIGTLDIQSSDIGAFSEDDKRIVQGLADQVAVAIENARLYERIRVLAVVEERNRLARELHDSVTQSLYAATLYGDATVRLLKSGQIEMAAENVRKMCSTTREALGEMRLLVFELRPPILQEEGIINALETRLEAVERRVGLQTALHAEGEGWPRPEVEEGLYRIAVEALNNVLKHARARAVTVSLRLEPGNAFMEVVDDGIGFDPMTNSEGGRMGLRGMAERAEQMGARFNVESEPGAGTKVRVEVDL